MSSPVVRFRAGPALMAAIRREAELRGTTAPLAVKAVLELVLLPPMACPSCGQEQKEEGKK